jgi:predicted kinase
VLLRTDELRRETRSAGEGGPVGFGEGGYSTAEREQVYEAMIERAARYLDRGYGVVLDATFWTQRLRARARRIASAKDVPFLAVEVTADPALVRERLAGRAETISDARWETYLTQRRQFEPLDEIPAPEKVALDAAQPVDMLIERVRDRLADGEP